MEQSGRRFPPMGTMIIRTWLESGHLGGFRARIIYGQTLGFDQNTVTTADPNEVLKVVQHWLAAQPGAPRKELALLSSMGLAVNCVFDEPFE